MALFSKKEKIILYSEHQKDDFIEKLDKAQVKYRIKENASYAAVEGISYIFMIDAADMKKVV